MNLKQTFLFITITRLRRILNWNQNREGYWGKGFREFGVKYSSTCRISREGSTEYATMRLRDKCLSI